MRIGIIYSAKDPAATNMAGWLEKEHGLLSSDPSSTSHEKGRIRLHRIETQSWSYDGADSLGDDLIIFLSKHESAGEVPALTVHSMGNWGSENKLGGKPHMLSASAPLQMLSALRHLNGLELSIEKTYEATHHGPLLNTPAFFMEMGGNSETINSKEIAREASRAVFETVLEVAEREVDYAKVVIGIGCGHYPGKFSRLALEKGYAFSYIMPKYAIRNGDGSDNLQMLAQAVEKTRAPELAVIEWKSLNSATRSQVLSTLSDLGLEHERL